MVFSYDIDDKLRFIVLYQDVTKSATRLSKLSGVPQSTIYNWINKLQNDQDILNIAEGRGRKPVIAKNTAKNLIRQSQRTPQRSSVRKLAAEYGISKSTAHNVLTDRGLEYRKVIQRIDLTDEELSNRVKFCKNMLKRKSSQIYNTFFSDEMGMNLSEAHIDKAWTYPGKRVKISKPREDVRVNCWGAISYNGATSLHIYKGSLKAETYESILSDHIDEMKQIYPETFQFQHDNLKAHKAVEDWGKDQGLNILDFPTYSPDLSPIENLWATLKGAVAADSPKTEAQLVRSLQRNWENLTTVDALRPYFEQLEPLYFNCIENNGLTLKD